MLKPESEHHFLHFTFQRAVRRKEQVLGKLLGQRRATLNCAARGHVGYNCTRQTDRIDTEMRHETAIFDRHDGLRNKWRHFMQADSFTAGGATIGNQIASDINDTHIRRTIRNSPVGCRWHLGREIDEHTGECDATP